MDESTSAGIASLVSKHRPNMFDAARKEVSLRHDGAISLFNAVCSRRIRADTLRVKGLAFVEMYAFYEYSVHAAVRNTLTAVASADVAILRLTAGLQSLLLDSEFQSCADSGRKNRWPSRIELFTKLQNGTTRNINVDLFPDDGTHYRRGQLATIWSVFGVKGKIVPAGRIFPLIGEIVERRNAVAHGRERPEDIGRAYSTDDVRRKYRQSRWLCRHLLTAVEKQASHIVQIANANPTN